MHVRGGISISSISSAALSGRTDEHADLVSLGICLPILHPREGGLLCVPKFPKRLCVLQQLRMRNFWVLSGHCSIEAPGSKAYCETGKLSCSVQF